MAADPDLLAIAREFLTLVTAELDPHTSNKGEIVIESSNTIVLLTPSHIQFAKYGRGPGKKPPLDHILDWVNEKGIIFDGTDQRGTAFAIQNSIGKKGTKNWVSGAPNALDEAILSNFEEYNKKLNDQFAVQIHDELQEIYKEILPDSNFQI